MRFKLTLHIEKSAFGNILPIDYQYAQSALIYRILSFGDAKYTNWLHDNGFIQDRKQFKFFNYSPLLIQSYKRVADRLLILNDTVEWFLTFLPERSTEAFVRGVFADRIFQLGDKQSCVQFRVLSVEALPPTACQPEMTFKALSPMCIIRREEDGRNSYLPPTDPDAARIILYSLKEKYKFWHGHSFEGDLSQYDFQVLDEPKAKLITIKAGTREESKVKGYHCRFKMRLPEELMELMVSTGIGSKGSQGFGMVGIHNKIK